MKKLMKHVGTFGMVLLIILTNISVDSVFAAENVTEEHVIEKEDINSENQGDIIENNSGDNETEESNILENDTDDNVTDESNMLENSVIQPLRYVVLDQATLAPPATQNIVVGIEQMEQTISAAKLIYHCNETGESFETDADNIIETAIHFAITYSDESETGTYSLDMVEYVVGEETEKISLPEIGIDITYGVNENVETEPDAVVTKIEDEKSAAETELDIVSLDEEGKVISKSSIPEAIASANETDNFYSKNYKQGTDGKIVVVLDPGHGGKDSGASGNGLLEKNLTLKIAQYCKKELESYSGIEVYMTRDMDEYVSLDDRVSYAKEKVADVIVSIHINSHTTSIPHGAEVYYPNGNYNPTASEVGSGLANSILENLTALGLADRGTHIRNRSDGVNYPDGSTADYYAIIRNSKIEGFTGIIVEHAFVSNEFDAGNYLNSDEKLQRLGEADASGIASFYNLRKKGSYIEYPIGTASITAQTGTNGTCEIAAANIPDVYGVMYAVWSVTDGGKDVKWYSAAKDEYGIWKANISLDDFKMTGEYAVHTYIAREDGSAYYMGDTSFNVKEQIKANLEVMSINHISGTFQVKVSGIKSTYSTAAVLIPVWSKNDQSDIFWYNANRQSDGSYVANIDIANHGCKYGVYQVHAYVNDSVGISECIGKTSVELEKQPARISLSENIADKTMNISGWHIPGTLGASIKKVEYAVWSAADGMDDLVFYEASPVEDCWNVTVPLAVHKSSGDYYVHTYVTYINGQKEKIAENLINIKTVSVNGIVVQNVNNVSGTFDVVVSNPQSVNGVASIVVPVWSKSDQSDIYWYFASNQGNGTYIAHVDVANHNCNFGKYQFCVYLQDGIGTMEGIGAQEKVNLPKSEVVLNMSSDSEKMNYTISGWHIPGTMGNSLKKVMYAVWSEKDGQDDLNFYVASPKLDEWVADVPISRHKTTGKYYVHAYMTDTTGRMLLVGETSFVVPSSGAREVSIQNTNTVSGTFDVITTGVVGSGDISEVQYAVWSEQNQENIQWYLAKETSDGVYMGHIDVKNHNCKFEKYYVHTYILSKNGVKECVNQQMVDLSAPKAQVTAIPQSEGTTFSISGWHIPGTFGASLTKVQYAVWSASGGQDDLVFYPGVLAGDSWYANVPIKNHKTEGVYYVHAYAYYANGNSVNVGGTSFVVTGPSAENIEIVEKDTSTGAFQVRVSGVKSGATVTSVSIPVWCATDQSDLIWYTPTYVAEGVYDLYVDPANHNNNVGNYKIDIYVADAAGFDKKVGSSTCTVNMVPGYYGIMGTSTVTEAQMVRYYNQNERYPMFYMNSDAPTIEDFCRIYIEECNVEGVKAEVAFCQAMKETGFLRFTGRVPITAYNFSGLGAIDSNTSAYATFSTVREGIRAQVQHLKAYASKEPLRNLCVDPRFSLVTRGTAPFVEWLGIQENPYGKGWATAKNYGYSVKSDYIAKLVLY